MGDFEREMHRLKTENRRLKDENLTAKKNLLDMETFAKESVDGGNAEEIIQRLKRIEEEEICRIEEKVWEGRIKDAHQRIEALEQEMVHFLEVQPISNSKFSFRRNVGKTRKISEILDLFELLHTCQSFTIFRLYESALARSVNCITFRFL